MGKKINDLIDAAKGTVGEILSEDAAPALITELLEGTVLESVTEIMGAVSPRIGGLMVAYKQKRWERNWETYIAEIVQRQQEINDRLQKLEQKKVENFKNKVFPIVSDYVPNEKQEEKIKYIVNGFVNLASGINFQEDVIIMYYDTLEQMSLLDIRILKCYVQNNYIGDPSGESVISVMQECGIDFAQIGLIKEKLTRLGLLESRNDTDMDNNIREMSSYMEAITKGKKAPKIKLKKINKSESYRATSYGRKVIKFFLETYSEQQTD